MACFPQSAFPEVTSVLCNFQVGRAGEARSPLCNSCTEYQAYRRINGQENNRVRAKATAVGLCGKVYVK